MTPVQFFYLSVIAGKTFGICEMQPRVLETLERYGLAKQNLLKVWFPTSKGEEMLKQPTLKKSTHCCLFQLAGKADGRMPSSEYAALHALANKGLVEQSTEDTTQWILTAAGMRYVECWDGIPHKSTQDTDSCKVRKPTEELTDMEQHIMLHAIGVVKRGKAWSQPYRNHYTASVGTEEDLAWDGLVQKQYATVSYPRPEETTRTYWLTQAGVQAIGYGDSWKSIQR